MKKIAWILLIPFACCETNTTVVTIRAGSGPTVQVQVEIADTADERELGLMFRENLPEGEGMLFVFPSETRASFWMKNTPISLDIIFIRNGEIVDLIENAVPYSETLLTPEASYTHVLEVPGGYASRHGIGIGDAIELPQGL